ncbi:hypothetical protein GCM10027430_24000 [Lysobacter tyrosinilyticus]
MDWSMAMPTASLKVAPPTTGHVKHFTIYRESGEWHWTLSAANSRKIARSAHGYQDKHDCIRSVRALSLAAYDASVFNAEEDAYEL